MEFTGQRENETTVVRRENKFHIKIKCHSNNYIELFRLDEGNVR